MIGHTPFAAWKFIHLSSSSKSFSSTNPLLRSASLFGVDACRSVRTSSSSCSLFLRPPNIEFRILCSGSVFFLIALPSESAVLGRVVSLDSRVVGNLEGSVCVRFDVLASELDRPKNDRRIRRLRVLGAVDRGGVVESIEYEEPSAPLAVEARSRRTIVDVL